MPQSFNKRELDGFLSRRRLRAARLDLRIFWGLLVSALTCLGCNGNNNWYLVPIEGVISQGGKPVVGVEVVFWPDVEAGTQGPRATGITGSAGHYKLHSDAGESGAVAGKYRVCIIDPLSQNGTDEAAPKRRFGSRRYNAKTRSTEGSLPINRRPSEPKLEIVPKIYALFDKTPLRAEIQAGRAQVIDFNIP